MSKELYNILLYHLTTRLKGESLGRAITDLTEAYESTQQVDDIEERALIINPYK